MYGQPIWLALVWLLASGCTTAVISEKLEPEDVLTSEEGVLALFIESVYETSFRMSKVDRGPPNVVVTPFLLASDGAQFFRFPAGRYRITAVQISERVYPLESWRQGLLGFEVVAGRISYPGHLVVDAAPYPVDLTRSGPQKAGTTRFTITLDVNMALRDESQQVRQLLDAEHSALVEQYGFVYTGEVKPVE